MALPHWCPASRRAVLLLVKLDDLVHVAAAAHDDRAAVMDVLRHDLQDASDFALEQASVGNAARLLCDERHGEALVEHPELALGRLLVRGVEEDAAVEQGPVHVRDHGAHVAGSVARVLAVLHVRDDGRVPLQRVALIAREDLLAARGVHLHVRDKEELAEGRVQREALHARAEGHHELRGRAVHAVAGDHDVRARPQDVGHRGLLGRRRGPPVDREDGAHADVAVDVGGAVKRVEGAAEGPARGRVLQDNGILVLLAHEQRTGA
mmetsp:Transcript_378/g.1138  ORF Transcript_378/g.1138 Transcript_378/m.1138 type:complete len:265 (-) Transcript_378:282-1076(-)